jgi:hypothetical protein
MRLNLGQEAFAFPPLEPAGEGSIFQIARQPDPAADDNPAESVGRGNF